MRGAGNSRAFKFSDHGGESGARKAAKEWVEEWTLKYNSR